MGSTLSLSSINTIKLLQPEPIQLLSQYFIIKPQHNNDNYVTQSVFMSDCQGSVMQMLWIYNIYKQSGEQIFKAFWNGNVNQAKDILE